MVLQRVTFSGRFLSEEEEKRNWRKTFVLGGIYAAVDVVITLMVGYGVYKLFKGYAVRPVERGFFCNDTHIRLPKKTNSVSTTHLLAVVLGTTPLIVAITEAVLFHSAKGSNRLAKYIRSTALEYLQYIIAFTICITIMECLKCAFGRLRPHFLEVCQPDWTKIDCKTDPNAFIEDAFCTGPLKDVRNSRTSFPSGHTSAAVFYTAFVIMYMHRISKASGSIRINILRILFSLFAAAWCSFVMVTRVTENWHFPSDVVGGFLVGLICNVIGFVDKSYVTVYEHREIIKRVKFE